MRRLIAVLIALWVPAAPAGSLADAFKANALGVPWGSTLDDVVGMIPGGQLRFIAEPYCRGYIVRDAQPLFGVPRDGMTVTYAFDGANRLRGLSFEVPPERREQLFGALYGFLGQPQRKRESLMVRSVFWPRDEGVRLGIQEAINSRYPTLWVNVSTWDDGVKPPVCW